MKNYNLLLLSSSNHVQLINSFKSAYENLKINGYIYTADITKFCASSLVSKKHFIIPRSDSNTYFQILEKIIKNYNINIVLSARDEELSILAKKKDFFEDLGCILLVSNKNSIALCRDKYELSLFFKTNNIPHPKTYIITDLRNNQKINYPLICKPRKGKGSFGILIAYNYDTILTQLNRPSEYIFQELIEGIEYTIDVLLDFDGNILSVIPRKRILVKGGESLISITEKNELLINLAQKISKLIGFIGHINIQCILKNNKPYFIEINPRFGGASNTAFKAGMDSPLLIMKMIKGEKIEPFIGKFKSNLMMVRYTQDFFINIDDDT